MEVATENKNEWLIWIILIIMLMIRCLVELSLYKTL